MTDDSSAPVSFPRQYARTQRFTLGSPRTFTVSPDGERVVFLRSAGGTDRANLLWVRDTATGEERVAADPFALLGGGRRAADGAGAGPARAHPGGVGRGGRLRGGRGRGAGRLRAVRAAVHRGAVGEGRRGPRTRRAGTGGRPAAVARRPVDRLRGRRGAAGRRGRRRRRQAAGRADRRRGGRRAGDLGAGGVRRRGGDGPHPRLLVVAGRRPGAGGPGGRVAGAAVVDRRPGQPRHRRRPRSAYPAAGTPERRGVPRAAGPGRHGHRRGAGTGRPTPTWRGCTGRPAGRRCCWSRPATSAPRRTCRSTSAPVRRAPCCARRTRSGWSCSAGCRPGLPDGRLRADRRPGRRPGPGGRRRGADRCRVSRCGRCSTSGADDVLFAASAGEAADEPRDRRDPRAPGRASGGPAPVRVSQGPGCTPRPAAARSTVLVSATPARPRRHRAGAARRCRRRRRGRLVRRAPGADHPSGAGPGG